MGAELRVGLVMVALDGRVLQRPVHSLDLTVAQGWFGPVRRYDERRCKDRWPVEASFAASRISARIATRYHKLARNFLAAVSLAAVVAFWL